MIRKQSYAATCVSTHQRNAVGVDAVLQHAVEPLVHRVIVNTSDQASVAAAHNTPRLIVGVRVADIVC